MFFKTSFAFMGFRAWSSGVAPTEKQAAFGPACTLSCVSSSSAYPSSPSSPWTPCRWTPLPHAASSPRLVSHPHARDRRTTKVLFRETLAKGRAAGRQIASVPVKIPNNLLSVVEEADVVVSKTICPAWEPIKGCISHCHEMRWPAALPRQAPGQGGPCCVVVAGGLWLKMAVLRGSSSGLEAEWLDLAARKVEAYSIEGAQELEAKKAKQEPRDKKKKSLKALKTTPRAKPKAKLKSQKKKKQNKRARTSEQERLKKQRQRERRRKEKEEEKKKLQEEKKAALRVKWKLKYQAEKEIRQRRRQQKRVQQRSERASAGYRNRFTQWS